MNASLSRYTASSILDRRILLNICKHASKDDLLSLSLVSQDWRVAAQRTLFREVNIREMSEGISTRQAAMAERLFWVHRSLTMSPHLALYIINISYDPLNLPNSFALFTQIMYLARNLSRLWLYLDNRKPTQVTEALKYRGLFQSLHFPHLLIHARQLDCIMFIPIRRFSSLSIKSIDNAHIWYTDTEVDLTEYRLNAQNIKFKNFRDEHPYGLGSSLWYTSSLLAVCLIRPARLDIQNCPMSPIRLNRLLRALGSTIEHLRLLCADWNTGHSPKGAKVFQATVEASFQWDSLLPRLKQLDTTFLTPSMGSLQTLEILEFSMYYDDDITPALKAFEAIAGILYDGSCSMLREIHLDCLFEDHSNLGPQQLDPLALKWQQSLHHLEKQIQEREIVITPASLFRDVQKMLNAFLACSNTAVRRRADASATGFTGANVEAIVPPDTLGVATLQNGEDQVL